MFARVREFLEREWVSVVWPVALFLAVVAAGLLLRRVVMAGLQRWAKRTSWKIDDLIVESVHGPMLLWVVVAAIYAATEFSRLPRSVTQWSEKALLALLIISFTLAFSRLAGRIVREYGSAPGSALPVGTLTELLASILIGLLGVLMLLNAFGISITPLLTALGVGGLAVALALQDTLSNFFSGFYLGLARQIRVGDFIQLEGGQRGHVADIGWRSTTLRQLTNNLIVIPNNRLAQSIVINYSLPDMRSTLIIPVSVTYASDPVQVDRVLHEVLRQAVAQVPNLLAEPAPNVRLREPGFGESSLDFQAVVQVNGFVAHQDAEGEVRKLIHRRFQQEGIEFAFPTRTIEMKAPPRA